MKNTAQNTTATPESVWAMLQEIGRKQEETARQQEEDRLQRKEMERILTEKFAETARRQEETDRQMKATDKKINKIIGDWGNNFGDIAEEYFFNSFERGKQNFFGEHFDKIVPNAKGINFEDEYDILLINGKAIGIIEVKFKANINDMPKILKKAETFRINFPEYKNHKIYIGLATLAFYQELEKECIENGIAIIKQVGDTIVINDEHLKAF